MDNRPIGLFDSGVGGLTVVKQVIKVMPKEETVYFGDTARVPYGSKTKETVTKFSSQIIRFLKSKDVKAIIIACNTVSSNSYEDLKKEFPDMPIIEVVTPGVESCIAATKNKKVSGSYEKKLKESCEGIEVYSKACPLFVPLAEEGFTNNDIAKLTARTYLKELTDKGIDSIILGCTHYPLLKTCIGEVVGESVKIVDPAKAAALKMKKYLDEHDMSGGGEEGRQYFYVSDLTPTFDMICSKVLKKSYHAEKIDIEKY